MRMSSTSSFSVEVVCVGEESRCDLIKRDGEKMFQTLREMGLDLGKVLILVRKCGEKAMIHLGGAIISGINALSTFPIGIDTPFGFVEMLSSAISSYIYSQDVLPNCPR